MASNFSFSRRARWRQRHLTSIWSLDSWIGVYFGLQWVNTFFHSSEAILCGSLHLVQRLQNCIWKVAWFPSIMLSREPLMSDNLLARLDWSDLSNFSWTSLSLLKIWRNSEAFEDLFTAIFPLQNWSKPIAKSKRFERRSKKSFLWKHAKTASLIGLLPLSSLTINIIGENFFKPAATTVSGLLSLTKKSRTERF